MESRQGADGSDHVDDVALLCRDASALDRFYRRHLPLVRAFVTRRTTDPHTAADLISSTFVAAIDASSRYSPQRGTPEAWLLGIAFRVVRAEERRQARQWRAWSRDHGRRPLEADAIEALEQQIDAERSYAGVREAYRALSGKDRALLELTAIDGLSIADAAQALGMQPGTARVRLHRARHRLRTAHHPSPALTSAGESATGPIDLTGALS